MYNQSINDDFPRQRWKLQERLNTSKKLINCGEGENLYTSVSKLINLIS